MIVIFSDIRVLVRNCRVLKSHILPSFVVTRTAEPPRRRRRLFRQWTRRFVRFLSLSFFSSIPPPTSTIEKCRPEAPPADRPTDGGTTATVCAFTACMGSWAVSCRCFLKAKPRGDEAGEEVVHHAIQRLQSFEDVFSLGATLGPPPSPLT